MMGPPAKSKQKGRNVIVCCDGTGISEETTTGQAVTPSNVLKIFNCIDTDNKGEGGDTSTLREQVAFYERGVATVGNVLTRAGAGMTGYGIATKIQIMYGWIGRNWLEYQDDKEEDRLYLFGFSRGAFAVRSLMGILCRVGLLDLRGLDSKEACRRVRVAYEKGYRNGEDKSKWAYGSNIGGKKSKDPWKWLGDEHGRIPVHFIGAFDTVGQLGLPRETWCLWTLGIICFLSPKKHRYHDVFGNDLVRSVRHAVAIDEMRSTFQPVYDRDFGEKKKSEGRDVKQVFFPGCHGNCGGGLVDTGLSDGALKWMIDEAATTGLRFKEKMVAQIKPNYKGPIYYTHGTSVYKNLTFYPRSMPAIIPSNSEANNPDSYESVHESAILRSQDPPISDSPYFDTRYLQVGETVQTTLRADRIYNHTFVYFEKNARYRLVVHGTWAGYKSKACGPEGYSKHFHRRPLAVNVAIGIGRLERGWRFITRNKESNLPFTRRHDHFPFYSVCAMVSTGGTRDVTSKADFHTIFYVGRETEFTAEKGGYLHCYANDTWGSYAKNKGFMELTIERIE